MIFLQKERGCQCDPSCNFPITLPCAHLESQALSLGGGPGVCLEGLRSFFCIPPGAFQGAIAYKFCWVTKPAEYDFLEYSCITSIQEQPDVMQAIKEAQVRMSG